jgi:uncharacterized protein (DUF885 family)
MKKVAAAQAALKELEAYKDARLSDAQRLNLDVILYSLDQQTVPAKFGLNSVQRPYRIFQQGGSYFQTPDFLNTAHTISVASDCDAYIAPASMRLPGTCGPTRRCSGMRRRAAISLPAGRSI